MGCAVVGQRDGARISSRLLEGRKQDRLIPPFGAAREDRTYQRFTIMVASRSAFAKPDQEAGQSLRSARQHKPGTVKQARDCGVADMPMRRRVSRHKPDRQRATQHSMSGRRLRYVQQPSDRVEDAGRIFDTAHKFTATAMQR